MAEVTFEIGIFVHGGDGNIDVTVDLSKKMVSRLSHYIEEHGDEGDDFRDVEELSDIYKIVDAATLDAITESLQDFPETFEDEFEENGIDIEDSDSVKQFVKDEVEYFIEWPCL